MRGIIDKVIDEIINRNENCFKNDIELEWLRTELKKSLNEKIKETIDTLENLLKKELLDSEEMNDG